MKREVVIIDYQLGNLFSVKQACEHLGCEVVISSDPHVLRQAEYAILPGVGAFGDAMRNMHAFGLVEALKAYVAGGKPLMGVCLGLQLLMSESEEFGLTEGLGIIDGKVRRFNFAAAEGRPYKVPQIQWNRIEPARPWEDTPLRCCKPGDHLYFVHSYYVVPDDPADILSHTTYGGLRYCSSVRRGNVFATQFHPEKSGLYGVRIYAEWLGINGNIQQSI